MRRVVPDLITLKLPTLPPPSSHCYLLAVDSAPDVSTYDPICSTITLISELRCNCAAAAAGPEISLLEGRTVVVFDGSWQNEVGDGISVASGVCTVVFIFDCMFSE